MNSADDVIPNGFLAFSLNSERDVIAVTGILEMRMRIELRDKMGYRWRATGPKED